jgi:phosphoribosylformylglycinamidine cyclo-ligase
LSDAYAAAGVNIAEGERAVSLIRHLARSTFGPRVISDLGAFSGLFRLGEGYHDPVLAASADGVGTKLKLAFALDRHYSIGRDLVNHCVNDILTCGARPLFFLDYIALGSLVPEKVAEVVRGLAEACRANECAQLGGETAEMPGFYQPGEYDIAGFIVGVVERDAIVNGQNIQPGDKLWALTSSGLHTNGYSLARKVLADLSLTDVEPSLGRPLGDALLESHRSYLEPMAPLLDRKLVKGMAHITGGGLHGNIPRMLPPGVTAELKRGAWPEPPIFNLIRRHAQIPEQEMEQVFNLGLGMLFATSAANAEAVHDLCPLAFPAGKIVKARESRVVLVRA